MNFEEFDKELIKFGYGIVAMNHFDLKGQRFIYCAIFNKKENKAYVEEDVKSSDLFRTLIEKIKKDMNK